jgi:hypothetical protein
MRARGETWLEGILAAAGPRNAITENRILNRNTQAIKISMIPKAMSQPRRLL